MRWGEGRRVGFAFPTRVEVRNWWDGGAEARKRVPGLQMVRRRCGGVRLALPLLYRWHCSKYDALNYLTADGGGRNGGTGWDLKDGGRGEPVEICRRQGGGGME